MSNNNKKKTWNTKVFAVFAIYNRRRFFTLLKMIETNTNQTKETLFFRKSPFF